jgi:hypothetical protein
VPDALGTPGDRRGAESITLGVNLVAVTVMLSWFEVMNISICKMWDVTRRKDETGNEVGRLERTKKSPNLQA